MITHSLTISRHTPITDPAINIMYYSRLRIRELGAQLAGMEVASVNLKNSGKHGLQGQNQALTQAQAQLLSFNGFTQVE
jgi:hypothetical protein